MGPVFAGDEESVLLIIPGDSVEHGFVATQLCKPGQATQVDIGICLPGDRIYTQDKIGLPDISPDFTIDVFQFIEIMHRLAIEGDGDFPLRDKIFRIDKLQRCRSIAEDELGPIIGQAPTFGRVVVGGKLLEAVAAIDEDHVGLPGELIYLVVNQLDAFAKIATTQFAGHEHFIRCQTALTQGRQSALAGALIEVAVMVEQALGKKIDIVGILIHHFNPPDGSVIRAFFLRHGFLQQRGQAQQSARQQQLQTRNRNSQIFTTGLE